MSTRIPPEEAFTPPVDPCPRPDKVRYSTSRVAEIAMKRLSRVPGKSSYGLNVYRCGQHFHIGHKPSKMRRS